MGIPNVAFLPSKIESLTLVHFAYKNRERELFPALAWIKIRVTVLMTVISSRVIL